MGKKNWIIVLLLLGVLNLVLFWPWNLYFLNDDFVHIPLTDEGKLFQNNSIRPLHELLVRLDLMLYGKQAYGFHITALLLHFIVCFQLYDLCFVLQTRWLKLNKAKAMNASFLATALFLIYPQHTESLAWILGRTPIMSVIFLMLTIRLFFNEGITLFTHFAGFLLFSATLFTYEQSILLPAILLWLASIEKDKKIRQQKLVYAVSISLAAIVYIIARKIITADIVGTYEGGNFITLNWQFLAGNLFRLVTRLWLNPSTVNCYMVTAAVSIIALCVLFYQSRSKLVSNKNTILFFAGIIILLIVPVVSLGITIRSYESGRYLYLPSIFLVMGMSIYLFTKKLQGIKYILTLAVIFCYWGFGKYQSAAHYNEASTYVLQTQKQIFKQAGNPILLDTLKLTIHRIPVFRVGFNRGLKWINPALDTTKIEVKYYYDEFTDTSFNQHK